MPPSIRTYEWTLVGKHFPLNKINDTQLLLYFPCFFLFQVAWTDQWNTLLTLDDRRIIDDSRISIERPYTRDWNLHIRKSEYNDRGQYTCQINTNPVKMKTVMLLVLGNYKSAVICDFQQCDILTQTSLCIFFKA